MGVRGRPPTRWIVCEATQPIDLAKKAEMDLDKARRDLRQAAEEKLAKLRADRDEADREGADGRLRRGRQLRRRQVVRPGQPCETSLAPGGQDREGRARSLFTVVKRRRSCSVQTSVKEKDVLLEMAATAAPPTVTCDLDGQGEASRPSIEERRALREPAAAMPSSCVVIDQGQASAGTGLACARSRCRRPPTKRCLSVPKSALQQVKKDGEKTYVFVEGHRRRGRPRRRSRSVTSAAGRDRDHVGAQGGPEGAEDASEAGCGEGRGGRRGEVSRLRRASK